MKMCYRGVTYDRSPVVPNLQQPGCQIYPNMAYVRVSQRKFMGQVCQQNLVSLVVTGKRTRFLGRISSDLADLSNSAKVNVIA